MADDEVAIAQLLVDVPAWALPSKWQWARIKEWVDWDSGCDPDGNFNGWCLIHDKNKEMMSAVYNFDRGVMRCQEDPSCHAPKRSMSIVNALKAARDA